MDAIRDLAFPLPVLVICELLGIPEGDQARFATGSSSGAALLNPTPPTRAELDDANRGTLELAVYFDALFELRRREPRDDLITQLVQAEEAGDRLTTDELRANVNLLFAAGHETTVNLIGNGLLSLLRHPEQWRMLRDDASLIPNAIEEILRFESPVQAVARTVAEPVTVSGVTLEPRAIVVALVGAANRDPGDVRKPGPVRHHPQGPAPAVLRWRHSFLPRCPTGSDRGGGGVRNLFAAAAGTSIGRAGPPDSGGPASFCAA